MVVSSIKLLRRLEWFCDALQKKKKTNKKAETLLQLPKL